MTNPTDAAIAQAYRELVASGRDEVFLFQIEDRARDLDAEKGGAKYTTGHCKSHAQPGGCQAHNLQCGWPECDRRPAVATPPAQAAEGVERVARAVAAIARPNIGFEHLPAVTTRECYRMARAAIAAMQAGDQS